MRLVVFALAAVAAVVVLVKGRKATRLAAKNTRRHEPARKLRAAARQKPGQVMAAKVPKPKNLRR